MFVAMSESCCAVSRTVLTAALLATLAGARMLPAQDRPTPRDSARADSSRRATRPDSTRVVQCPDCLMLIFPAAAVWLAAPSVYLFGRIAPEAPAPLTTFWTRHAALYLTGGPTATQNPDLGWTHTEGLELLAHGAYMELRGEHYYLFPQHIQYALARVGWFAHPTATASGGLTVGYRGTRGPPIEGRQQGVELAFPVVIDLGSRWWRFEPYYVASLHQTTWNYRIEAEWPIPRRSELAGFRIDAMSLPIRNTTRIAWVTIAAVIGVH